LEKNVQVEIVGDKHKADKSVTSGLNRHPTVNILKPTTIPKISEKNNTIAEKNNTIAEAEEEAKKDEHIHRGEFERCFFHL